MGRVALVTGASRGIGEAISKALKAEGCEVAATYAGNDEAAAAFTEAQEGARAGITANPVCPGYIGTEMVRAIPEDLLNAKILPQIPAGRLGEPEEIARCVTFLTSDEAGFINGSTISANGAQFFG